MKYQVTLNGKNYDVEVEKGEAQVLAVSNAPAAAPAPVAAVPVAAPVAAAPVAAAPAAATASGSGDPVAAPMPGTITDIKVTAGTTVQRGQVLLILEAMKMENEIVSPRQGTVSSICIEKGATVSTGDVLLRLN